MKLAPPATRTNLYTWRLPLGLRFGFGLVLLLMAVIASGLQQCKGTQEMSYLGLRDDAQYAGSAACQSCHSEIYDSYLQTGMGRSLYKPNPAEKIERFGPNDKVYDAAANLHYRPFWRGDSLYIMEYRLSSKGDTSYTRLEAVDYIIGSGHQTRSYLIQRQGYLYEAPITWYVNKQLWDLSPGYHNGHNSRFDREIGPTCLNCHNAYSQPEAGTLNRYKSLALGIDCERCHGPASFHVEKMARDELVDVGQEIDYTIVNPDKLSIDLQFDVCQQCHLQGLNVPDDAKEFRPGMALASVRHIFLPVKSNQNDFGIASHAERLRQSACFLRSDGKLTCTTCHNPHETLHGKDKSLSMNKVCQNCHADAKSSCATNPELRMAEKDNCAGCHMPHSGTDDIPHVQFTDHRIRVVKPLATNTISADSLKAFFDLHCATAENIDAAIKAQAMVSYYEQHDARPALLAEAEPLLATHDYLYRAKLLYFKGMFQDAILPATWAVALSWFKAYPRQLLAQVLESAGKLEQALAVYTKLYADFPTLTDAGLKLATLTIRVQAGKPQGFKTAKPILLEIFKLKPTDPQICTNLGFVYLNISEFDNAERYLNLALAANPDYLPALENLVYLHTTRNNIGAAKAAYQAYAKLVPDDPKTQALAKLLNGL